VAARVHTEADNRNDYFGIVVDDLLARTAFPGQNAVGQRLYIRSQGLGLG
jgi:hypothetical protein